MSGVVFVLRLTFYGKYLELLSAADILNLITFGKLASSVQDTSL
jgi:hypothetical protein